MAWSWSHTEEAIICAKRNLERKSKKFLWECYGEWMAEDDDGFNEYKYQEEYKNAQTMTKEDLVGKIWSFMFEDRTCDNGGHNAYCCPDGCHTVSFS